MGSYLRKLNRARVVVQMELALELEVVAGGQKLSSEEGVVLGLNGGNELLSVLVLAHGGDVEEVAQDIMSEETHDGEGVVLVVGNGLVLGGEVDGLAISAQAYLRSLEAPHVIGGIPHVLEVGGPVFELEGPVEELVLTAIVGNEGGAHELHTLLDTVDGEVVTGVVGLLGEGEHSDDSCSHGGESLLVGGVFVDIPEASEGRRIKYPGMTRPLM